jgi:hypothetical protein
MMRRNSIQHLLFFGTLLAAPMIAVMIYAWTDGICDVTMTSPANFLEAHDVIGVGILEEARVVRTLEPTCVFSGSDTADPVVMLYRVRVLETIKGEVDPVVGIWRLEQRGRRSTLRPEQIWRMNDTLVFYGDYLTGQADNQRLFRRGQPAVHLSPNDPDFGRRSDDVCDSMMLARVISALPQDVLTSMSTPRGTLILEDDDELWDLNHFRRFCCIPEKAKRMIETDDYLDLLREQRLNQSQPSTNSK